MYFILCVVMKEFGTQNFRMLYFGFNLYSLMDKHWHSIQNCQGNPFRCGKGCPW